MLRTLAAVLLPLVTGLTPPHSSARAVPNLLHRASGRSASRMSATFVCPTWIGISQATNLSDQALANITVVWGETPPGDYPGGCTPMGNPDGGTFSFTVNGTDRTSYFTVSGTTATATNVPVATGSNTLVASIQGHDETGSPVTNTDTQVKTPPNLTLVLPAANGANLRAIVHSRMPLVLATYSAGGPGIDTTTLMLKVRSTDVTALARRNLRLLEWELDSLRQLTPGDTAGIYIRACDVLGWCNSITRRTVLDNSGPPIVSFTGMPLEAHGRHFGSPFGPGLAVSGAEVETGFGVPPYFSMNAARSTGLVYSTRQSYPRALVNVDVELTWPTGTPSQVKAVLIDGITRLDSLVVSSPGCFSTAGNRCRVTLQGDFSGTTYSRAARKWLNVEVSVTSGGTTKTTTDSTEVVLVDRRSSPYGSGWFVSGVLRLDSAGTDMLLVGPTGAASLYRGSGGAYISPPGDFGVLAWTGSQWELRFRNGSKLVFDSQGRETRTVEANGNTTTVSYGAVDRVDSIVDPAGKKLAFSYDGGLHLTTITDPGGRQSKVTIDGSGRLTYDSLASPSSTPAIATYGYTAYGGNNTVVLSSRGDPLGQTTRLAYDPRRRPAQDTLPAELAETGSSPVSPVLAYRAQELRGLDTLLSADSIFMRVTDARGNWARAALNRWGAATRTWDALGTISRASYTAEGFAAWAEGKVADSSRVYFAYDGLGRLVKSYRYRTSTQIIRLDSLVYDASHNVTRRVDPRNQVTSFSYDANHNLLSVTTPTNDVTNTWYRSNGQVDSSRAPTQTRSTRFHYDATWKNTDSVVDAQGVVEALNFSDSYGRTTESQRRLQITGTGSPTYQWRRTLVFLNAANQTDSARLERTNNCSPCTLSPTSASWPSSTDSVRYQQVRHVYNKLGLDSLRTDTRGRSTRCAYDGLGRLRIRWPLTSGSVVDSFRYDVGGNLRYHWTRRGLQIEHVYDSRSRDTATVVPGIGTYRRVYGGPGDQLSSLSIASYGDSIGGVAPDLTFSYDQSGFLTQESAQNGLQNITHVYDKYGRDSVTTDAMGTWRTRYETARGVADTLLTPFGDTLTYAVTSRWQMQGPTVQNGAASYFWRDQQWTGVGTLRTLDNSQGYLVGEAGDDRADPSVSLNPVWTEKQGSTGPTVTMQDSLTLDGWERVLTARYFKNGSALASETYSFDVDGNLTLSGESRTYDATTGRITARAGGSYSYDAAGNLTSWTPSGGSTWSYTYDALERLIAVRQGGTLVARYAYDAVDRRIVKRVYSGATAGYVRMLYRGGLVAAEADSAQNLALGYTWGAGDDDLVAVHYYGGGQDFYAVQDALRSVRALARRDGTFMQSWRYGIYGALMDSAVVNASPFRVRYRWIGREYDAETGFYFVRARYYDPQQQRFTQEDPGGYASGANLYAYGDGNPTNGRDLDGLNKFEGEFSIDATGGGGDDWMWWVEGRSLDSFSHFGDRASFWADAVFQALWRLGATDYEGYSQAFNTFKSSNEFARLVQRYGLELNGTSVLNPEGFGAVVSAIAGLASMLRSAISPADNAQALIVLTNMLAGGRFGYNPGMTQGDAAGTAYVRGFAGPLILIADGFFMSIERRSFELAHEVGHILYGGSQYVADAFACRATGQRRYVQSGRGC